MEKPSRVIQGSIGFDTASIGRRLSSPKVLQNLRRFSDFVDLRSVPWPIDYAHPVVHGVLLTIDAVTCGNASWRAF